MKGKLLKGKRIYLGPVKIADAKVLAGYFNQVKHFLGADTVKKMTIEEEKKFIRKLNAQKNTFFFAIRLNHNDKIVGSMSIFSIQHHHKTAETGTMIGESYTNQGYGTEAKHLLLDFAFNTLGLRKIYSKVHGYNDRSRAYSLKCGYIHEATLSEKKLYQGKYWDEWTLSITKPQWEEKYNIYKEKYLS